MKFDYQLFYEQNFQRRPFCSCLCCSFDSQFGCYCIYFMKSIKKICRFQIPHD